MGASDMAWARHSITEGRILSYAAYLREEN